MAEARINEEIAKALSTGAAGVPEGRVCEATLAEWDEFQTSDNQVLKSSRIEWIHGMIYIVEMPSTEHGDFIHYFNRAIGRLPDVVDRYFKGHSTAYVENRRGGEPRLEPDASYSPLPGAEGLPQGFASYGTLVVEVGHTRTWGRTPGMLDWKAQRWAGVPGVHFVLCVAVTDRLATAEYKLYSFRPSARPLRVCRNRPPVSIIGPKTEVSFDARLLLGLQPSDPLPRDPPTPNGDTFPDPLVVDLYQVLVLAQRGL